MTTEGGRMKVERIPNPRLKKGEVLILRTSDKDRKSCGGFQWPEKGEVSCPDWNDSPECGHGLHGLLKGEGDAMLLNWNTDAIWQVVATDEALCVAIDRKVKFPKGRVIYSGKKEIAVAIIKKRYPCIPVVGVEITGGYDSTITGGDRSTLTGGDDSTITGGYGSTITGGYGSTITGGDRSTITGGYGSTITGGDRSTITGGDECQIVLRYWNGKRYKYKTGEIGEAGLKPNTPYRLNAQLEFEESK